MKRIIILGIASFMFFSCTKKQKFSENFDNINDRYWVGRDFWSIPLEDWKVENGTLHCAGVIANSRVNVLTHVLSADPGNFNVSAKITLEEKGNNPGSAGFLVGVYDSEDPDIRAACYHGKGIQAGISAKGYLFLKDERTDLPEDFDFTNALISLSGNDKKLLMEVTDGKGRKLEPLVCDTENLQGLIALAVNMNLGGNEKPGNSKFSFDELTLSGSKVVSQPENSFGPVLWTMHTLSRNTLKLMALLPPVGVNDNQQVILQLNNGGKWEDTATEDLEADSRTAVFKIEHWDDTRDVPYRVVYVEKGKDGSENPDYYEGTIRKDPVDRPLRVGGLTCQFHFGFPYTPLVQNLTKVKPDLLYFSGDQIYEGNGGYPIKREPADVSILSYLGKYYMFGWSFGELMRDVPTICTPDDHDVFHGNLWGESGIQKPGGAGSSDTRGFIQDVKMVNVVNRTNCGQLPDPYDPEPIEQGMSVWYTQLVYGKVSFAIISDRIFKTGPEAVSDWEGRHDHMIAPRKDLSFLDKPGVKMLGDRQLKFLNDWKTDWKGVNMKVLLSQTVFANVATHHGGLEGYLYGDLDSGGWPKSGRDKAIQIMRQTAAFQICGDQHLPSLVQYGLNEYQDANWCYCTPAIAVMYLRWFLPDEVGYPVLDRPDHGYPNTGKYTDAFGNKNYVYAIGNPGKMTVDKESRYNHAQIRASGFGLVTFDTNERTINIDAWRFKADVDNPNPIRDQFPGWPVTISQFDNLGKGAKYELPEITSEYPDPVVQIINEKTGDTEFIYRIKGNSVVPALYQPGTYTVMVGEGETRKEYKGMSTQPGKLQ